MVYLIKKFYIDPIIGISLVIFFSCAVHFQLLGYPYYFLSWLGSVFNGEYCR